MTDWWFEDFEVGLTFESAGVTFTEAAIVDFALRYDPQRFHIDAHEASQGDFGGLIASGFHTLSQCFRAWLDTGYFRHCNLPSPGIDQLRWMAPVRPGDTLRMTARVLEQRPSASKPDRGIVKMYYEGKNQRDEVVLSLEVVHFFLRRPTAAEPGESG